jgi:hypothetical protein
VVANRSGRRGTLPTASGVTAAHDIIYVVARQVKRQSGYETHDKHSIIFLQKLSIEVRERFSVEPKFFLNRKSGNSAVDYVRTPATRSFVAGALRDFAI